MELPTIVPNRTIATSVINGNIGKVCTESSICLPLQENRYCGSLAFVIEGFLRASSENPPQTIANCETYNLAALLRLRSNLLIEKSDTLCVVFHIRLLASSVTQFSIF